MEQREGISQFVLGASAEQGAQSRGDPQPRHPHNAKGKEPAGLLGSAESRHSSCLGEKGTVSAKSLITNITPVKFWSLVRNYRSFPCCSAQRNQTLQTASVNLIMMSLNGGEKKTLFPLTYKETVCAL